MRESKFSIDKIEVRYYSGIGSTAEFNQDNYYINGTMKINLTDYGEGIKEINLYEPGLIAVFDGMGGEKYGDIASLTAATCMDNFIYDTLDINRALEIYYDDFKREMESIIPGEISGTTCAALLIKEGIAYPFWAGDSRIYLFRRGVLTQITKDHTVAQEAIDEGMIDDEEKAKKTKAWNVLTRFMGGGGVPFQLADKIKLEKSDKILICSDGISDMYSLRELSAIMKRDSEMIINTFKYECENNVSDNSSAIILDI